MDIEHTDPDDGTEEISETLSALLHSAMLNSNFTFTLSSVTETQNIMMWLVDELLGNDREISSYTTAVVR
jgi:hypothetical protein